MKIEREEVTVRIPHELWITYKQAALYSKQSLNKLVCDVLDAKKNFIKKKYIPNG